MKIKKLYLSVIGVTVLLAGCGVTGPIPQTAEEYRRVILADGYGTQFDTYVVDQPYSKVAATLKTKSKECLAVKMTSTRCMTGGRNCKVLDNFFTPTIAGGANKTELHLQWRTEPDDSLYMSGTKPPVTGAYIVVADAVPAGNGKTKLSVYATKHVFRSIPQAIKNWATGTNMGCPSMAYTDN